jgi:hypothetical protein
MSGRRKNVTDRPTEGAGASRKLVEIEERFVKNLWIGLAGIVFGMTGPVGAQQQSASAPETGTFFPSHWVRGYVDFAVAPPTNEPDLGRCASYTGQFGANAPCADFARYMTGGYVEVQPFGRTALRRVFLFAMPLLSLGNNVPQVSYTAAATPIALDSTLGVGFELPRNFELRVVRHSVYWLGRYGGYLGAADLGTGGLYGHYATVGARWYFGGWGRTHEMQ